MFDCDLGAIVEGAMPGSVKSEAALLLEILDQGYDRPAWHGPSLRQALRGVSAEVAAWRPGPGRHNIWELAVHAAYWKYIARRRLLGQKRGSFALKGSNWFRRPVELSEKAWREDLALLESEHRKLRTEMVDYLNAKHGRAAVDMLFGVAFHDIYHAGQIRLLLRLQDRKRATKRSPNLVLDQIASL